MTTSLPCLSIRPREVRPELASHLGHSTNSSGRLAVDVETAQTWVTPVMVLWADFPQRVVEGRCAFVHGDELVTWLRSRRQTIAQARTNQVAEAVRAAWTPARSENG